MPQGRVWQTVRTGREARSDPFQLLVAEHELLRAQLRRAQTGAHRADVQRLADAARTHMHRESRALHPTCERLFGGPDGAVAGMRGGPDRVAAGRGPPLGAGGRTPPRPPRGRRARPGRHRAWAIMAPWAPDARTPTRMSIRGG